MIQRMVVPISQTAMSQNPIIGHLEEMILRPDPWIDSQPSLMLRQLRRGDGQQRPAPHREGRSRADPQDRHRSRAGRCPARV